MTIKNLTDILKRFDKDRLIIFKNKKGNELTIDEISEGFLSSELEIILKEK